MSFKQNFKSVINTLKDPKTLAKVTSGGVGIASLASSTVVASAAIKTKSAEDTMKNILGVITTIAMYVGILLLAWGAFQLFMAFKNEDADSKQRAFLVIIAGIALTALKTIITAITGMSAANVSF